MKIENFMKKFISSILFTPKFQKIINSFFNSYFPITKRKLKKSTNGTNLLITFGKFKSEKLR